MCSLGKVTGRLEALTGEVIGWRQWRLDRDRSGRIVLQSLVGRVFWNGRDFEADRAPEAGDGDRHGVHAYAPSHGRQPWGSYGDRNVVSGEVGLSGIVVVHERGCRAERARILRLELRECGVHGSDRHYCACTHGAHMTRGELE